MSGTSTPGPAPDALELAALLCSRVCHDLISPVGAIVNGLEVLDDNPKPEDRDFALDLIRKSAKTASARLQFCRLAFGAAGSSGAQIDLGDALNIPRGGTLTVDPVGEGDQMSFRVTASGLNARLPQNIATLLSGDQGPGTDAHAVQPYYTRLLAESCGLKATLAAEGDAIVVAAS